MACFIAKECVLEPSHDMTSNLGFDTLQPASDGRDGTLKDKNAWDVSSQLRHAL